MNAQDLEIFRNSFGEPMTRAEAEDFILYAESLGYKIEVLDTANKDILMQHPDDEGYPEWTWENEEGWDYGNPGEIIVNGERNFERILRVLGDWWESLSPEEREELEQDEEE